MIKSYLGAAIIGASLMNTFYLPADNVYNMFGTITERTASQLNTAFRVSDTLHVNINSPGGFVDMSSQIYNDSRKFKERGGTLSCTVYNKANSCAALFLSHCDLLRIEPNATVTFHVYRKCMDLMCSSTEISSEYSHPELYHQFLEDFKSSRPYLTSDEIASILQGKDVVIQGSEFKRRWELHNNALLGR